MKQTDTAVLGTVPDKVYERPMFKTLTRAFGAVVLVILNFALIGSDISQLQAHLRINYAIEGLTYLAVFFFDFAILGQIIFEVRKVCLWSDHVALDTMFWHAVLIWDDILELRQPRIKAVVVLRTKTVSYIICKKDFAQFPELLSKLEGKIGVQAKSA